VLLHAASNHGSGDASAVSAAAVKTGTAGESASASAEACGVTSCARVVLLRGHLPRRPPCRTTAAPVSATAGRGAKTTLGLGVRGRRAPAAARPAPGRLAWPRAASDAALVGNEALPVGLAPGVPARPAAAAGPLAFRQLLRRYDCLVHGVTAGLAQRRAQRSPSSSSDPTISELSSSSTASAAAAAAGHQAHGPRPARRPRDLFPRRCDPSRSAGCGPAAAPGPRGSS